MGTKRRSGGGFIFGLMLGVALGAALAILLAPAQKGQARDDGDAQAFDLRQRGQERFGALVTQWRQRYNDAVALGQDAYVRTKDTVIAQYNQAKS